MRFPRKSRVIDKLERELFLYAGVYYYMLIEKSNNNGITINVSPDVDSFGVQRLIDYGKYLELTAKSKAKQSDADKLAEEVNRARFAKKN